MHLTEKKNAFSFHLKFIVTSDAVGKISMIQNVCIYILLYSNV